MIKEHRLFVVLKAKSNKWYVFCDKKAVSSAFDKKKEAEEYKSYLRSR